MIKQLINFKKSNSIQNIPSMSIGYFSGKISDLKKLPQDLKQIPQDGKVIVFTRQNCPFCELTKDYFSEKGVEFEYFYCDILGITDAQKQQLAEWTGGASYPRIFIGQHSIGGFDDLRIADEDGTLDKILKSENVPHKKYLEFGIAQSKVGLNASM